MELTRRPLAFLGCGLALGAVMLGALYALTRSLWVVIGVHFAWNVVQGVIFGFNVSGTAEHHGWLTPIPVGNPLLSGGEFGVEGSIIAVAVCSIVTAGALVLLIRRGGMVRAA